MKEKPPRKDSNKADDPQKHGNELPPTPKDNSGKSGEWKLHDPQGSVVTGRSGERTSLSGQYMPVSSPTGTKRSLRSQQPLSEREIVHQRLKQAGVLANDLGVPRGLTRVSDEELERTGDMRPGARPSEELIDEDRGR